MKEKILEILKGLKPNVDYDKEKLLIDDGIFDSFTIISLVGEFNDEFDISIHVEDLVPENFNSVEGMQALIEKLQSIS